MDRFDRPVVIEDPHRIGGRRSVGSVREAIECLAGIHWPRPYGAQHRAAERACLRAHAGEILPEAARQAFMEAAREAGILIGEARVGGGQQTEGSPQGLPVLNHERDPPAVSEACAERGDEPFSPEAAQEVPARGSQQTEESTQGLPAHHHERDHPAMSEVPFSPIRDILMVVLLPAVIIMALVAAVVVVFGGFDTPWFVRRKNRRPSAACRYCMDPARAVRLEIAPIEGAGRSALRSNTLRFI